MSSISVGYRNDLTGASAFPPGMLLKIVLFAYSQGIISSRGIERACREQMELKGSASYILQGYRQLSTQSGIRGPGEADIQNVEVIDVSQLYREASVLTELFRALSFFFASAITSPSLAATSVL